MLISRAALAILVIAIALAVLCHPRVFYGNGSSSFISLDGMFYAGQWLALFLALGALVISLSAWRNIDVATRAQSAWVLPALSGVLIVYLVLTGVPHERNKAEWRNRELGIAAYVRGVAKGRKANAKPVLLPPQTLAGKWRDSTNAEYTFLTDRVTITGGSNGSRELSNTACAQFSMRYVQKDREALQEYGFTWSTHAGAVYDSTANNAVIAVAEVSCGTDRYVFIRATPNEVWRWSNFLDADDIRSDSFVLRKAS